MFRLRWRRPPDGILLAGAALWLALAAPSAQNAAAYPAGDMRKAPEGKRISVRQAFLRYCAACHGPYGEGDGPGAAHIDPPPRDLTRARYMRRLTKGAILRVIREGGAAAGRSRFMPPYGKTLGTGMIEGLVDYVKKLPEAKRALKKNLSLSKKDPSPGKKNPSPGERNLSPAEKGKRLAGEMGCTGCHTLPDQPTDRIGPDLTRIGSRLREGWMRRFLLAPETIRPLGYIPLTASRMPDFRLSKKEAADLAAFLSAQGIKMKDEALLAELRKPANRRRGETLFREKGCGGCHGTGQKGAGQKSADQKSGRAGPDLAGAAGRLHPRWVVRWLFDPQRVDPRNPMPNFGLTREEIISLAAYVLSLGEKKPASSIPATASKSTSGGNASAGRELFEALGCAGCHRIEWMPVQARHVGPGLAREGDRAQKRWLPGFLEKPRRIRPNITPARMPGFGFTAGEIRSLAAYLGSLRDPALRPLAPGDRFTGGASPARLREARRLMDENLFGCLVCHPWGSKKPANKKEDWGPDLGKVSGRLTPRWIYYYLKFTRLLDPASEMPAYFSGEEKLPKEIAGGDAEKAILLLRDLLATPFSKIPPALR